MLERPDAGDAGNAGEVCKDAEDVGRDAGDCPVCTGFTVCFEGRATWHQKPVAGRGCFGVRVLRVGDAGNAGLARRGVAGRASLGPRSSRVDIIVWDLRPLSEALGGMREAQHIHEERCGIPPARKSQLSSKT